MKPHIWLLLFALSLLFFLPTKQTFALEPGRSSWLETEEYSAALMADRVNEYRRLAGMPPFADHPALWLSAQKIADHMAATEFISHFDGDGANPNSRAEQFGYTNHVTEIIYGGFGGADAAWEWWMANALHESLILSKDYHELGVGMATGVDSGRVYWAIVFGSGLPTADEPEATATSPIHLTKLPTSATMAVPSLPPNPTETTPAIVTETPTEFAEADDQVISVTEIAPAAIDPTATPPETAAQTSHSQDTWLIIAAAATILCGILFFYFPRIGWSR